MPDLGFKRAAASWQSAEHGEQLSRAHARTGMSVESLSTLGYAAQQAGVDFDTLQGSIGKMNKTLVEADRGGGKQTGVHPATVGHHDQRRDDVAAGETGRGRRLRQHRFRR